eukprot:4278-Lingulodinium_polyedra.AAC.1
MLLQLPVQQQQAQPGASAAGAARGVAAAETEETTPFPVGPNDDLSQLLWNLAKQATCEAGSP